MYAIRANEDVLPLSEFRAGLAGCIVRMHETRRPILVTQNGRTAGIFMDAALWDDIQERLERLETYQDILISDGQISRGETTSLDDLETRIKARQSHKASASPSRKRNRRIAV